MVVTASKYLLLCMYNKSHNPSDMSKSRTGKRRAEAPTTLWRRRGGFRKPVGGEGGPEEDTAAGLWRRSRG